MRITYGSCARARQWPGEGRRRSSPTFGLLESCGVMVPPTVSLFHAMGWPGSPLTFAQAFSLIEQHNLVPRRMKTGALAGRLKGNGNPALEARGLHFDTRAPALSPRRIDLTIRQGEFVAILGQNGSGKTTLAKHFNGLFKPSSGAMLVSQNPRAPTGNGTSRSSSGMSFRTPTIRSSHPPCGKR